MINLLNEELLEESLLKSDFTYGFELEGVAKNWRSDDYNYEDDGDDDEEYYDSINDTIMRVFKSCKFGEYKGSAEIQHDGSIETNDNRDVAFEWASPIFKATPKNFAATMRFLYDLPSYDIETNESCGFHHHISWKGITERDMIWTYINLCMDEGFINSLKGFTSSYDDGDIIDIDMSSERWASTSKLKEIREAILNKDWKTIVEDMSDDKYRILRIHPYGTIEWRGPRDFLEYNQMKIIHDFYIKFNEVISKVIECQNMKTISGTDITKEELFKNMTEAMKNMPDKHPELEFLHRNDEYRDRHMSYKTEKGKALSSKIIKTIEDKPLVLYHLIMANPVNVAKLICNAVNSQRMHNVIEYACDAIINSDLGKDKVTEMSGKLFEGFIEAHYNINKFTYFCEPLIKYVDMSKKYLEIINNLDNVSKLYEFISQTPVNILYSEINNIIPQLLNQIIKVASHTDSGDSYMSEIWYILNGQLYAIVGHTELETYTKKIANIAARIAYKFLSKSTSRFNINNYNNKKFITTFSELMTPEESKKWNRNILAAMFETNNVTYMPGFLINFDTFDDTMKKQLYAFICLHPDVKSYFDFPFEEFKNGLSHE